jgi:ribosomal protein L37AE/L43A
MTEAELQTAARQIMGVDCNECPRCGKRNAVMRLVKRQWVCQKCADELDKEEETLQGY